MNILLGVVRIARRGMLLFLLLFWTIFLGYSTIKLIEGGPREVGYWYRHIGSRPAPTSGQEITFSPGRFDERDFWSDLVFYLAATLLLAVFEVNPRNPAQLR